MPKRRGRLAEIFGYRHEDLGYYRDLALSVVAGAGIAFFPGLFYGHLDDYDVQVSLGGLLIALVCLALTPNRMFVLTSSVGMLALGGWRGVFLRPGEGANWVAIPFTAITGILLWKLAKSESGS